MKKLITMLFNVFLIFVYFQGGINLLQTAFSHDVKGSAFDEIIAIPLFSKTIPVAVFLMGSTMFLYQAIKILRVKYGVDVSELTDKALKFFSIISFLVAMLLTLTKDQFDFLGGAISFALIFLNYCPKDIFKTAYKVKNEIWNSRRHI